MSFYELVGYTNRMEFLAFSQHPALALMLNGSCCGDGMHTEHDRRTCEYTNKMLIVDRSTKRCAIVHYQGYSRVRTGYRLRDMGLRVWDKICEVKGLPKENVETRQTSQRVERMQKPLQEPPKEAQNTSHNETQAEAQKISKAKMSFRQHEPFRRGPLLHELHTAFDTAPSHIDNLARSLITKPSDDIIRDIGGGWVMVECDDDYDNELIM